MTYAEQILPEFDQEMASTRKLLAGIPDDKLSWKAHEKLNSIGWNACHVAEIPGWVEGTIHGTSFDFSPPGGPAYETPNLSSTKEILEMFDKNVAAARAALASAKDEEMGVMWTLLFNGEKVFTMPRVAVIRGFVMNHLIHHRAHLCAYMRMIDLPVPGMYGPGGSETPPSS